MEAALVYDQVNVGKVACMEILARRFQLVEERCMDEDDDSGSALVCPTLQQYVGDGVKAESAVLRARRKGRDQRSLANG